MKRITQPFCVAAALLCSEICAAGLESGFRAPPDAAKPQVWWHWMAGNVTRAGITADLEAMAEAGIGGAIRPGIVHRIDKDTSGLLVVAKNDAAHQALSAQMSVHSIHRVYHAVVYGNLREDEGFVERWIGRDPHDRKKMAVLAENAAGARYAYTGWRVQERYGNFTYIACKLKTGRTHQIRVHMASTGHPLAGDAVYGPKNCIKSLNGQCLHAKELGFVHPKTGEWMQFDSPLPPYFTDFLTRLRKEHRA